MSRKSSAILDQISFTSPKNSISEVPLEGTPIKTNEHETRMYYIPKATNNKTNTYRKMSSSILDEIKLPSPTSEGSTFSLSSYLAEFSIKDDDKSVKSIAVSNHTSHSYKGSAIIAKPEEVRSTRSLSIGGSSEPFIPRNKGKMSSEQFLQHLQRQEELSTLSAKYMGPNEAPKVVDLRQVNDIPDDSDDVEDDTLGIFMGSGARKDSSVFRRTSNTILGNK